MILLNFAQKLHDIQFEQFTALTSMKVTEQIMLPLETSDDDLEKLLDALFTRVKLTDEELKKEQLVINLPAQTIKAIKVISYLYKRSGCFPLVLRTSTSAFGLSIGPAVVEVIDLQKMFQA